METVLSFDCNGDCTFEAACSHVYPAALLYIYFVVHLTEVTEVFRCSYPRQLRNERREGFYMPNSIV
jgi:hypothetical protein